MKQRVYSCLFLFLLIGFPLRAQDKPKGAMAYVDPFIGSAGDHGQLSPAATLPFGMVKPGPETDPGNHSGYDYNSKKIRGFTHNRIEGTGCNGAGGNILIQPGLGEPTTSAAVYDKSTEKAEPGYYSVVMQGIKAELTATNAAGFHRYTFPKSDNAYLLIDLASSFTALLEEHHTVHAKKEISGSVKAKNVCNFGSYQFYYTIYINKNIDSVIESGHRVYLLFSTQKDEEVTLQVSLSPVSVEQARKDGQTQLARFSFDQIRQQAREKWTQVLEKVQVSGDETYKKIFYTHLYHSYLAPFNLTSADGIYKSSNGKIYAAKDYTYYYSWAIWDNFRTQLPLLTVLEPTVSRDMAKSLVSLYEQGKHDWPVDTEPYISVRTEHAIIVLLDYYKKGLLDVNHLQKAYKAIKEEARGFPFSGHGGNKAPSLDSYLEMSYDEWGIAQLAKALKQDKDYAYYLNKSARYKKIWEEHFKIMGDSADIIEAKGLYEGTYWQYRWFVPHDVAGIISMLGGKEEFVRQLAYFFENNLYNHANQPDIQAPFMFHFAGKPWLSQKQVNQILTKDMVQRYGPHAMFEKPYVGKIYKATPDGYIPEMDDDVGTMAAWYVWSAIGMFPACVGEPYYLLTSPVFNKINMQLENGKTFEIEAINLSDQNFYIQSATLNGKKLNRYWLSHKEITSGGKLQFIMGSQPNEQWGKENPYVPSLTKKR